jgi:hypothetical protein
MQQVRERKAASASRDGKVLAIVTTDTASKQWKLSVTDGAMLRK